MDYPGPRVEWNFYMCICAGLYMYALTKLTIINPVLPILNLIPTSRRNGKITSISTTVYSSFLIEAEKYAGWAG